MERKWTYLVAALLMGGVTTSLTSCIDNEEPAGITDLRGAKAELLRAKAQVEVAEAAIKNAQAQIEQAKADYLKEKVAQEKLKTDYLTAKNEDKKIQLQQEAAIREQQYLQNLYNAQTAAKEAELNYQKALAQIEIALATVKDDAYAAALNALLYDKEFTYKKYVITTDDSGKITISEAKGEGVTTQTIKGLINLSTQLAGLKQDLAKVMRENLIYGYQFDKEALKNDVAVKIEVEKAELKVQEEALAELKTILGVSLEDFEAKYKEIADKKKEAEENKTNVSIEKAQEMAESYNGKAQELANKRAAESEFTFDIPADIQNGFYDIVEEALAEATKEYEAWLEDELKSKEAADDDSKLTEEDKEAKKKELGILAYEAILKLATVNTEGDYAFTNGMKINATAAVKQTVIDDLKPGVEANVTTEDLAKLKKNMELAVENEAAQKTAFEKAEEAWKAATDAYDKAYKADKYHITGQSERDVVIAAYEAYGVAIIKANALTKEEEKTAAIKKAQDDFIKAYDKYLNGNETLAGRTKLDGFKPADELNILSEEEDADINALFTSFVNASDDERFGNSDATEDGGLYEDLKEAADNLGRGYKARTAYTYEEWTVDKENGSLPSAVKSGTATCIYYSAIDAQKKATEKYEAAVNTEDWATLLANIEKVEEAVLAETNALQLEEAELDKIKAAIDVKYATQEATYGKESESYGAILNAMVVAVPNYDDKGDIKDSEVTQDTYDQAIENLKAVIADWEGASLDEETGAIILGSISQQKQEIALYENLLKGLEDGSYETAEETLMNYNDALIDAYNMQIEVLQVLFDKANAQKDSYIEALTSGSSSTPVEPETPAE